MKFQIKMDKSRRVRRTSSPQQNLPTTSSSGVPASTSSTKFTIEQKVTTGAVKKGPNSVKRSVDLNDVVIKRRLGEGSKPLFSRVDICVNRPVSPKKQATVRASSSDSSSSEDRNRCRRSNSSRTQMNKRKSVEKVPYFLDQKREKDRIRRVYGQSRRSRSLSPERKRRMAIVRNRSRTPPSHNQRHRSYGERRSPSRDRYTTRHRSNYRRSRSRSSDRRRMSHSHRTIDVDERHQPLPPATQFITIPVPVNPYMQPTWGPPMMPPQPRFPFLMRPSLPPPIPYIPRHFRPQRYVANAYQRGNFRPRQY